MSEKESEIQKLVDRAVDVLQHHAPPTGLTDRQAISEFYSIFDHPACWKALPKGAPEKQRTEASHILQKTSFRGQKPSPRLKVTRSAS